ncbi:MAG: helix-turn-helix transcriptional regulator [Chitinophagaceae bacterium]|nr:helix-turn-helix transcriptional regulator [Chitinophagaceae bacterium]
MQQKNPLLKGSLITIILKLLSENDKMYGYEITRIVQELSQGSLKLTEGALYPSLHKLEADGLLEVSIENIGNRSRKYYSLTKKGKKESVEKLKELNQFFTQMQQVLNLKLSV